MAWDSSHSGGVCCIIDDIDCLGQFKEKQPRQREQIRPIQIRFFGGGDRVHRLTGPPPAPHNDVHRNDRSSHLALNPFRPITLSQPFHSQNPSHPTHHGASHATSSSTHPVPGIDKPVSPPSTLATPRRPV